MARIDFNVYYRYRRPWAFGLALYLALIPWLQPLAHWLAIRVGRPEISTNGKDWQRL